MDCDRYVIIMELLVAAAKLNSVDMRGINHSISSTQARSLRSLGVSSHVHRRQAPRTLLARLRAEWRDAARPHRRVPPSVQIHCGLRCVQRCLLLVSSPSLDACVCVLLASPLLTPCHAIVCVDAPIVIQNDPFAQSDGVCVWLRGARSICLRYLQSSHGR